MKTLLLMTLGGSALALLLLALRYLFLRRMPSTVYYYAWLLVLLRFALPLPGLIPPAAEMAEAPPAAPVVAAAPAEEAFLPPVEPGSGERRAVVPAPEQAQRESDPLPTPVSRGPEKSFAWPAAAQGLWCLGAFGSLGFTLVSYFSFTARLRRSLRRPDAFTRAVYGAIPGPKPALFRSGAVNTPLMYGVFSPRIVLPERTYDEELLKNILRHELTHYRRGDALYKWLAVLVLSAHWFNPLSWLSRREIARACELSCDETLLRGMSREEKQRYGETLLQMAASAALPIGVVATTFSTEKKHLKERLEQIMTYRKSAARPIAAVLTLALLAACGTAAGPAAQKTETPAVPAIAETVRVSDVDELLAAIAPNTLILLGEGEYDLSSASTYGESDPSPYYSWTLTDREQGRDGYELTIHDADGLSIFGAGPDRTTLAAVPRYANVLKFVNCNGLTLSELTAGHTREPGFCRGGVICLERCGEVSLLYCGLFGCGTVGVSAADCSDLSVADCRIYECSSSAVNVTRCRNVRVTGNEVCRHGVRSGQGSAVALFSASNTDGFVVSGNGVYANAAQFLLTSAYSQNAFFLNNDVHDNRFETAVFSCEQYPCVVDGCAFRDNSGNGPDGKLLWTLSREFDIVDRNGETLSDAALEAMTLEEIDPNSVFPPVPAEQAAAVPSGEEIAVTSVDEFLKAIGPERTIVLENELFDLSEAAHYGSKGGEYYYWKQNFDGPALVVRGVRDLTIKATSDSPRETVVSAVPRYADVLSFVDCENITLSGFTAGHTKEPGSCSGGVLLFENCSGVLIERCRLFGCGILGLQARYCKDLRIEASKIYECSQGAASFFNTDGIAFSGCVVTDVPSPALSFNVCTGMSWNGEELVGMRFDIDDSQMPVDPSTGLAAEEAEQARRREVALAAPASIDELENPCFYDPAHSYDPDSPAMRFAAEIQGLIADGDWETLSKKMFYPLAVYTDDRSFHLWTETEFVNSLRNESFCEKNGIEAFRQRVAAAPLEEFGECIYGVSFCDQLIAFSCFGASWPEDLRVTCLSLQTPLWPGNPAHAAAGP